MLARPRTGTAACRWPPVSSGAHVRAGPGGGGARRRGASGDRGSARRSRTSRADRDRAPRRGRTGRARACPPRRRGRRARVAAPACRREPRAGERAQRGAGARPPTRDERAGGDRAGAEGSPRRARLRRRGFVEGRAAVHARHPHGGDRGRESGTGRDRGAGGERGRGRAGRGTPRGGSGDVGRCGALPPRHLVAGRGRDARRRYAGRRDRGPVGGARSDAGASCPRGRGGRRPQPPDGGVARCGQDDARPAAAHDPAGALARRVVGSDPAPFGRRPPRCVPGFAPGPAVPGSAPLGVDGRAPRRGEHLRATGRGEPRAPRRPLPRRADRVPP